MTIVAEMGALDLEETNSQGGVAGFFTDHLGRVFTLPPYINDMKHLTTTLISSVTFCLLASACSDGKSVDGADGAVTTDTESTQGTDDTGDGDTDSGGNTRDATGASTSADTGVSDSDAEVTSTPDTDSGDAASSDTDTSDEAGSEREPVDLGQAINYAILAKSAISATGATAIVGDVGLSPADATYITGFGLDAPPTTFATSDLVTGKIWAPDYDAPTPVDLTTAILDMEAAYTDAAGRTLPDFTELGAGNIDGMTLTPGLYKWGTGVNVPNDITLEGAATDVWILQIGQDLLLGNGASVTLAGDAQAKNIFWQVAGQATLGTTSSFQGILLSQTLIEFNTGAMMTGRAYAQTAVTLDATVLTAP